MTRPWLSRLLPAAARRAPRRPDRFAPRLAELDDRTAPATYYVDPTFAGQTGTQTFNAGQPNQTAVVVGSNGFATIAEALAAANLSPGTDQILLSNGTHPVNPTPGSLRVNEPLQLTGSGKAVSVVQVVGDANAAFGPTGAVFRVGPSIRLDVADLTFDGGGIPGGTAANSELVGSAFWYDRAVGTVSNVLVCDVIDESTAGTAWGYGVVASGVGADVTVQGSAFENLGRGAVRYDTGGTGLVSASAFAGRAGALTGFGVEVVEGARNVLVTGSTFAGFTGTSATEPAAGVRVADLPDDTNGNGNLTDEPATAALVGNVFTGNRHGVVVGLNPAADASDAFLQFNAFQGNGVGVADATVGTAIRTDTTQEVSALRNYWGHPTGPLAANNQTASGDNAGAGDSVGPRVLYRLAGTNPNDGILIAAPPAPAGGPGRPVAVPPRFGATADETGANAAADYITLTGFDATPPQPAFGPPVPITGPQVTVTVRFGEPVTGFEAADLVVSGTAGGKVVSVTPAGPAADYQVTLSVAGEGTVVLAIPAGAAVDPTGNRSLAAGPAVVAADANPPTAVVHVPGARLPVQFNDPVAFFITFSEPVNGFDASDIQLGGTSGGGQVRGVSNPSGDRREFAVTVGGFARPGTVQVTILPGAVTDDSGNPNAAVGPVVVAGTDTTPPTVAIAGPAGVLPVAFTDPLSFVVTFSEPVSGFDATDVRLGGSQQGGRVLSVTPDAAGKAYTVAVGGFTQAGTLTAEVPDSAARDAGGNGNLPAGPVTIANATDATPPTAVITAPGGALPVTFATAPLDLIVTFSEPVSGFDATDVAVGGTAKGGRVLAVVPQPGGRAYAVHLTGFTTPGTVTVALQAAAAADAAGNPSAALGPVAVGQFSPPFGRGFAVGGDRPLPQPFYTVGEDLKAGKAVVPFESGYTGGVRVATADVTGDGTLDVIVGAGVGRVNEVKVYDGRDLARVVLAFNPFETSFTGGVFVTAADLTGDGKAEIVVTPDESGGPRVQILDGAEASSGRVGKLHDFFGIDDKNFRGGARAGTGDLNADGTPDLFVSAGFGGGPRVAVFDGRGITLGRENRLVGDFFGYEQTLRNGVYVAGGDLDGDGFAEVILGAGPGGGPRVRVLSGKALLADGSQVEVANFFAGDESNRGGVRVAGKELDGDGRVDIVTGPGQAGGSTVRVYLSTRPGQPAALNLFGDFNNGVYVG